MKINITTDEIHCVSCKEITKLVVVKPTMKEMGVPTGICLRCGKRQTLWSKKTKEKEL